MIAKNKSSTNNKYLNIPHISARTEGPGVLAGGAHPGQREAGGQQRGEMSTALQRSVRPGETQS